MAADAAQTLGGHSPRLGRSDALRHFHGTLDPHPCSAVAVEQGIRHAISPRSSGWARTRSISRTADQTIIAWFWNDEAGTCTPPGHWNQIAQEVALARKTTLPENARLFALLNIALADAAIVCWEGKYRFKLWRPITAIRHADDADDERRLPIRAGLPLLTTPAFPVLRLGTQHVLGAGAAVLEGFFGTDEIAFTIGSDGYPGMQREFTGFWQAAEEAGRSRIYGGIHYECDNREGTDCRQGNCSRGPSHPAPAHRRAGQSLAEPARRRHPHPNDECDHE